MKSMFSVSILICCFIAGMDILTTGIIFSRGGYEMNYLLLYVRDLLAPSLTVIDFLFLLKFTIIISFYIIGVKYLYKKNSMLASLPFFTASLVWGIAVVNNIVVIIFGGW